MHNWCVELQLSSSLWSLSRDKVGHILIGKYLSMKSIRVQIYLFLALYLVNINVNAATDQFLSATNADVASLSQFIRGGQSDIFMVNMYSKSCTRIIYRAGVNHPYQTVSGSTIIALEGLNMEMVRNPNVAKEFIEGHQNKMRSTVNRMKFTRVARSKANGRPYLWETKATSRVCMSQAVYTDGTVECRKYLDAGTSIYGFVVGAQAATQLTGKNCTGDKTKTDTGKSEKISHGIQETATKLRYEIISNGSGRNPQSTDRVTVHYVATLTDGTLFDSTYTRGEPMEFKPNQVIDGLAEGLLLMKPGAKFRLFIPSELAYGSKGVPGFVGSDEDLIYTVELIDIK